VGHDTNATDTEKRTPLHYAVAYRCGLAQPQPAGTCLARQSWPGWRIMVASLACS
jgi:hypothetical protein